MTELEQQYFDYIQSIYPRGLRNAQFTEESLVRKYDVVRSFVLAMLKEIILWGANQLLVDTATENGILEWELFLGLPINPSLTLDQRRANIKARLSGNPATIANLRKTIEAFLWNTTGYTIEELRQTSTNPDDVWTYIVNIYNSNYNNPAFFQPLVDLLRQVHPAHCELIMWYTYPIQDAIGIEDATDSGLHDPFIWALVGTPLPSDTLRSSYSTPLVGGYWS